MRGAALLLALAAWAAPAAAQETGPCRDGMLWWSVSGAAGIGPCDAPWEASMLISCATGRPTIDLDAEFGVEVGAPASAVLRVGERSWELAGEGATFAAAGGVGMALAPLPDDALAALRAGVTASFETPMERRDIHLTGSAAALAGLCG